MKLLRYGMINQERPAVLADDGTAYDALDVAPEDCSTVFFADAVSSGSARHSMRPVGTPATTSTV